MATADKDLDAVFSALANPTRRAIVERLVPAGELSAGDIAQPFRMTGSAISRHLRILEQAGIIERRIDRQWRYVHIQPQALALVETWLAEQRRHR
jgi:DNA-binding transcriptional ArsR family regulator